MPRFRSLALFPGLSSILLFVALGVTRLNAQCDNGPVLDATSEPSKCGNFNGLIILNVTGGTGPVDIYLDGTELGDTISVIDAIPSGFYNLEAIDSLGCLDAVTVYVDNIPGVRITDVQIGYSECDSIRGAYLDVQVNTANEVEYSADGVNFQQEPQLVNLPADSITVFVRDEFGCTDQREVYIPSPFPNILRIETIESDCSENDSEIWAVYYASLGPYFVSIDGVNYIDGPVIRDLGAGSYTLYVRNELGCVLQFPVNLAGSSGIDPGEIEIDPASCDSDNGAVVIEPPGGIESYILGDSENPNGVFQMLRSGQYVLRYIDTAGCERDTLLDVPEVDCEIYFSNVFSPNGDGVNDTFTPVFQSNPPESARMEIANRWGSVVYSCTGNCAWDGRVDDVLAENGVYVYVFIYRDASGSERVISGDVTLLR